MPPHGPCCAALAASETRPQGLRDLRWIGHQGPPPQRGALEGRTAAGAAELTVMPEGGEGGGGGAGGRGGCSSPVLATVGPGSSGALNTGRTTHTPEAKKHYLEEKMRLWRGPTIRGRV